jgi:hypothetical protein
MKCAKHRNFLRETYIGTVTEENFVATKQFAIRLLPKEYGISTGSHKKCI